MSVDSDSEYSLLDTDGNEVAGRKSVCFNRCRKAPCFYDFKSRSDSLKCCLFSGIIASLFIAIIVPMAIYSMVDGQINEEVVIDSPQASSYDTWQTNTMGDGEKVHISYNIYLFDIQNPEDIVNGTRPIVVEKGPYAFKEFYWKFDIEWHDGGDIVEYQSQKYYIFDPVATDPGLSLDDELTLPYVTFIAFEYLIGVIPAPASAMLDVLMEQKVDAKFLEIETQIDNNPNMTLPAKVALKNELESINGDLDAFIETSNPATLLTKTLMCGTPNGLSPFWKVKPVPGYFGWLNDSLLMEIGNLLVGLNQTDIVWPTSVPGVAFNWTSVSETRRRFSPTFQHTGKKDVKKTAQYIKYNNMTTQYVCVSAGDSQQPEDWDDGTQFAACAHFQTEWNETEAEAAGYALAFKGDYANRIAGTDAQMFGRPVTSEKLQVYVSDIYRTAFLQHSHDTTDWHGISLRRYTLQMKDLQNATMNPEAAYYYQFGPDGVENLTAATGVTSFVSKPHFLDGADSLTAEVEGISPDPAVHETYLDVEPQTGLLARAMKRLQANYLMTDINLPTITQTTADQLAALCAGAGDGPPLECAGLDALVGCLSVPTDWKFPNGQIFFPYAWVEESAIMSADDANDLKDGLYWIEDFAVEVQMYGLVCAALFFMMLCGVMFQSYLVVNSPPDQKQMYRDINATKFSSGHQGTKEDMKKDEMSLNA